VPAVKPTGKLLLQTSVLPVWLPRRVLRARGKQPFDADVHYHQWTQQTMTHLLARAGYRVERVLVPRPPSWAKLTPVLRPAFAPRLIFEAAPTRRSCAPSNVRRTETAAWLRRSVAGTSAAVLLSSIS